MLIATPMTWQGTGVPAAGTRTPVGSLLPTAALRLDGTRAPFAGAAAAAPVARDLQALVAAPPPRGAPV